MVCNRCIMVVAQQFKAAGLEPSQISMGEVELAKEPTNQQLQQLDKLLTDVGFEILDDKKKKIIEQIKNLIIAKVQTGDIEEEFSLSNSLSKKLHKEYTQLSRLFSEVESITIEQFYILQKIEKVKEWLAYDELTLSEIYWKLGYSSVAHLSAQFKKITGLTPSEFKKLNDKNRNPLDKV